MIPSPICPESLKVIREELGPNRHLLARVLRMLRIESRRRKSLGEAHMTMLCGFHLILIGDPYFEKVIRRGGYSLRKSSYIVSWSEEYRNDMLRGCTEAGYDEMAVHGHVRLSLELRREWSLVHLRIYCKLRKLGYEHYGLVHHFDD